MSPETIALIIKWGPLALVGVVFLWCFLLGVIRGTYKVTRRLIYVILYVALVLVFIEPLSNIVLNLNIDINGVKGVRAFIVHTVENNETINKFLNYSPNLYGLIVESPELIVNPILFIVLTVVVLPLSYPIYWIYLIIFNLIAKFVFHREKYEKDEEGNVLRNDKGKKVKVNRKKKRLLGGFIRGAQGVALICLVLLPVNMINRVYNKAKKNAELENGETICNSSKLIKGADDICKYFDLYNETIFAKLGGEKSVDKLITDRLMTVKYDKAKLNLEDELKVVAVSVVLLNDSGVMDLFDENGNFNLDTADFSVVNFDKLDLLVDTLFSSTLISEVSDAGAKYVLNEVVKDDLVKLFKDDDIVSKLEYKNSDEIKQELKDVVGILKFAVQKNLVDKAIDNKDNVVSIVNNVNSEDIETLLNKILSLRILSNAMPSVIEVYGEKYGVETPSNMEDFNEEVAHLFGDALKLVQTLDLVSIDDLTEGDMLNNVINALFENGALKSDTKEGLASLLNDLNQSQLFDKVLSSQINKLLEKKDYKVDARVLNYVDCKEAWLKELSVLDKVYSLYSDYKDSKIINYSNVTSLLNNISGTKIILSAMPFAYDELLPKIGIEVDSEGFPVIDFDGENEDASKAEFYNTWEAELTVLKNVADAVGVLELQSLDDIKVELLDADENVDALATIMSEIYNSKYLKDPFVDLMKDTLNEFVVDFNVEFTKSELLAIDTKDKWKNEFSNISDALSVDISNSDSITGENLDTIFTAIGNMKLFDTKRIEILKYVVQESEFLTQEEYDSISWPGSDATQAELDAFWNNETSVLVRIVEDKDVIQSLADTNIDDMNTDEIGEVVNVVMSSEILKPIVVNKVSDLLVENGVKDDRDVEGSTINLKNSIEGVTDWKVELATIKNMVNSIDEITVTRYLEIASYNTYDRSGEEGNYTYTPSATGVYIKVEEDYYLLDSAYRFNRSGTEGNYTYSQADLGEYLKVTDTRVDDIFETIEDSELLQNSRANLLLKAVDTINIVETPSDVTVSRLKANDYELYDQERDIIVEVSKNKNAFDNFATMDLDTIDTNEIGGLLDTVTTSIIFEDYVVEQIVTVFEDNDIYDDSGDQSKMTTNIANVNDVSSWKTELAIVKEMLTMTSDTFDDIDAQGKTKVDIMFENIEESLLLQNSRANILIKAVNTVGIDGVSVPTGVDSISLSEASYDQYNKETAVLKTFSHNVEAINGLGNNIDSIDANVKTAVAELLDDMKLSKIFKEKYVTTVDSVLANIDTAIESSGYDDIGVAVNKSDSVNGYVNIDWNKEINTLSTISANIEEMSTYNSENISENKEDKIATIGSTLEAIETSSFLGAANCQIIANSVVSAITDGLINEIDKPADKTWTETFNAILAPLS